MSPIHSQIVATCSKIHTILVLWRQEYLIKWMKIYKKRNRLHDYFLSFLFPNRFNFLNTLIGNAFTVLHLKIFFHKGTAFMYRNKSEIHHQSSVRSAFIVGEAGLSAKAA